MGARWHEGGVNIGGEGGKGVNVGEGGVNDSLQDCSLLER